MEIIKQKIIDVIIRNRISSVEVADALGKTGVLEGPKPLSRGKFVVGEVQYIYGHSKSNWAIHEQGEKVKEGGILYVDVFDCENMAAFGDIVAKYFLLYKRVNGLVVNGLLRDAHTLIKENYSIWCRGTTPLGCYNKEVPVTEDIYARSEKQRELLDGSLMVCDDSGCTVIGKEYINIEMIRKLEFIEFQEDIWYFCIDTLKWSTYKTICQKAYLQDKDVLPDVLRKRMEEFDL
jgi:4-hydroxy-4-methyl-2-oxoglutarate aldolase